MQVQISAEPLTHIKFSLTSVRRTRIEGCSLGLRDFLNLSVQFTCRSLVEFDFLFHTSSSDSIQHTKHTNTITIRSVFGHVEGNLHVTHCSQVVNFGWFHFRDDADKVGGIAQISIMQVELDSSLVTIFVDVVDATGVETRRTTDNSMDLVKKRLVFAREW